MGAVGEMPGRQQAAVGRVPDFYVVGHQKCGTTALYMMLRDHPQIFMPAEKEPRYFCSDLYSRFAAAAATPHRRHTLEGYLELFRDARPEQLVGEATPDYLRSSVAAERIAELAPQARIVAIFREPAGFLRSFHQQMLSSHVETCATLREALELEQYRRSGEKIPRACHHPKSLLYSEHVRYVEQLRRFHAVFPREQVLVLLYDEFLADNEGSVRTVLGFLGVDDRVPVQTVRTGPLETVRSPRMHQLAGSVRAASRDPRRASAPVRALNALVPQRLRTGPVRALWRRAAYGGSRREDEQLMLELRRRFKPEVLALGDYLGRDLVAQWGYDTIA